MRLGATTPSPSPGTTDTKRPMQVEHSLNPTRPEVAVDHGWRRRGSRSCTSSENFVCGSTIRYGIGADRAPVRHRAAAAELLLALTGGRLRTRRDRRGRAHPDRRPPVPPVPPPPVPAVSPPVPPPPVPAVPPPVPPPPVPVEAPPVPPPPVPAEPPPVPPSAGTCCACVPVASPPVPAVRAPVPPSVPAVSPPMLPPLVPPASPPVPPPPALPVAPHSAPPPLASPPFPPFSPIAVRCTHSPSSQTFPLTPVAVLAATILVLRPASNRTPSAPAGRP